MSWLPDYIKGNMKSLKCFICNARIKDNGATIQYGYIENGESKTSKVMICTKCADELDKPNTEQDYEY